MDMSFDHLQVIEAPEVRGKLEGLQELSLLLEQDAGRALELIPEKRGMVRAAEALAKRMDLEKEVVQKAVDSGMDPDEAKARIHQVQLLVGIAREMAAKSAKEAEQIQGRIDGLHLARKTTEKHFESLALKYERHQREAAEDEEELRNTIPHPDDVEAEPTKKTTIKARTTVETVAKAAAAVAKGQKKPAKRKPRKKKAAKRAKNT